MKKNTEIKSRLSRLALIAATAVTCQYTLVQSAQAGGFAVIEQGASGMGNAFAGGAAVSHDASTVWFNPAGMLELKESQLAVAGHLVGINSDFTDSGTTLNPAFGSAPVPGVGELDVGTAGLLPNLYYVRDINSDLVFGFGLSAPFAAVTEYDRDWVGRYQSVESSVSVINFNPSLAYRVNEKVNIGGGINLQLFDATLGTAVDSGAACLGVAQLGLVQPEECAGAGLATPGNLATDGYADISGDSIGATFNLGVLIKPQPGTRIGLAYRHSIDHELDGDAKFTNNEALAGLLTNAQLPLFANQGAKADANMPSSAMLSFAHQANDKLEILADATFTGWSSFSELRVRFENPQVQPDTVSTLGYKDVWRVSAGLNYQQSDKLTLRAGVAYDEDPVPSAQLRTSSLPGNDITWLAIGLGYKIDNRMNFDFGFAHLFIDDSPIDNASEDEGGTITRGDFETDANILSAQFNYKFR